MRIIEVGSMQVTVELTEDDCAKLSQACQLVADELIDGAVGWLSVLGDDDRAGEAHAQLFQAFATAFEAAALASRLHVCAPARLKKQFTLEGMRERADINEP
jgi:hypothetical protein